MVKGKKIRPTSDRIRESLFDIMAAEIEGCSFLDCYAGSGAIGIEALSRGAERVVFVEADRQAIAVIKENLRRCHLEKRAIVIHKPYERSAKEIKKYQDFFDIIFADPPYQRTNYRRLLEMIDQEKMLHREGIVIIEHLKKETLPTALGHLGRKKVTYYGQTALSFYQFRTSQETSE